mmetsp:Transcript_27226/g.45403  ORF Transcript_27226/g.45403 Transcript_27226/m.45403 type:complete len:242 (-) Transcript_27226:274-999(-)|eukprot:CAMPEP_0119020536 /NCGR_PEP_ID=MMETSP1176-20130426/24262_1 /TAXON_ID=265551 /ORGANISM="Synedropsis recta cf, Strain CCMP1620" /LENGTH=241 /DNA_ID=CAMNT_0006974983 /DNA_START=43 /DNA_END=768 /DNA_ORIENTATION=-
MTTTALFKVRQAALPILSLSKTNLIFPVHRIYCVGRNYRDHAIEMGHDPDREPPFFFHKPADAVTTSHSVPYPTQTSNLHYEAELVVAIGKGGGMNIQSLDEATSLVYGYAVGCDLTRRDLQNEAKKMSRPWDTSKGFDSSAPMTAIVPKTDMVDGGNHFLETAEIKLWVDNDKDLKQSAPLSHMIWSIPETIQHLSRFYRLVPGDLIMTGTPSGVGPIDVGDEVRISCGEELPECRFTMV